MGQLLDECTIATLARARWISDRSEEGALNGRRSGHPWHLHVVDEHVAALRVGEALEEARFQRVATRGTAVGVVGSTRSPLARARCKASEAEAAEGLHLTRAHRNAPRA